MGDRFRASVCLLVLAALVVGACDGGGTGDEQDNAPTVTNEIQDRDANADGDPIEVDLSTVFSAPSSTTLTYEASSSNADVATVSVNDATLTVTPGEGGEADVTVTATNDAGEANDTFAMSVFADPPGRP